MCVTQKTKRATMQEMAGRARQLEATTRVTNSTKSPQVATSTGTRRHVIARPLEASLWPRQAFSTKIM